MLAATTPGWISENLTESMVGGGFMARCIPIYEETVRRRQLYYEELNYAALDKLRDDLVADLNHFGSAIEGEFKLDPDAKFFSSEWYNKTADKYEKEEDTRLHGYYERKPAYAFKLAMLLRIAYSDDLLITLEDFQKALKILEGVERKMLRVYSVVGGNPYTEVMDKIVEFVRDKKKVEKRELLGRFYHEAPPEQLLVLISGLIAMEKITADGSDPRKITYRIVDHSLHQADLTRAKINPSPKSDQASLAPPPDETQLREAKPQSDS